MGRDALEAIDDTVGVQLPLMGRIMKDYSKSAPRTPGTLNRDPEDGAARMGSEISSEY